MISQSCRPCQDLQHGICQHAPSLTRHGLNSCCTQGKLHALRKAAAKCPAQALLVTQGTFGAQPKAIRRFAARETANAQLPHTRFKLWRVPCYSAKHRNGGDCGYRRWNPYYHLHITPISDLSYMGKMLEPREAQLDSSNYSVLDQFR